MRKAILLFTALIVTFGAFAKGPMTASAPSLAAVFGHFGDNVFADSEADLAIQSKAARELNPAAFVKPSIPATQFVANELAMQFAHVDLDDELAMLQTESADRSSVALGFDAKGWMTLSSDDALSSTPLPSVKNYSAAGATVRTVRERNELTSSIVSRNAQKHTATGRTLNDNGTAISFAPPVVELMAKRNARAGSKPAVAHGLRQSSRNVVMNSQQMHRIEFIAEPAVALENHFYAPAFALEVSNADSERVLVVSSDSLHFALSPRAVELGSADKTLAEPKPIELEIEQPVFQMDVSHSQMDAAVGSAAEEVLDRDLFYVAESSHQDTVSSDVDNTSAIDRDVQIFAERHALKAHGGQFDMAAGFNATDRTPFVTTAFTIENSHSNGLLKSVSEVLADAGIVDSDSLPTPPKSVAAEWFSTYAAADQENKSASANAPVTSARSIAARAPAVVTGLATLNTAALSDSPRILPGLPVKKAAVVVTGMSTLNIEPMRKADGNYCDSNFIGEPIRFSQTAELKLEDLLLQIHNRFGVNFLMGPNVGTMPINIKAGAIPWNVLLKSQLFISGIRARCINSSTIELVQNSALPSLQDQADVETRFVKLKFLQRTTGNSVDLAGRSQGGMGGGQGGCAGSGTGSSSGGSSSGGGSVGQTGDTAAQQGSSKFDKLIIEIEKILGLRSMRESSVGSQGGNMGASGTMSQQTEVIRSNRYVTQIPGRNILAIRATREEFELIDQIIERADRPPFQVVIKGLVYTANQDKLQDIGVQTTITGGTADGRSGGGIFGHTLGVPGTLFDFSTVIGTFDFNVQATALQRNGVISVKNRPFATVLDGLCTTLEVGRQIPIVIDSTLGGQGDVVFVSASNKLAVTPYVVDDDDGNPVAVTLEIRLDSNDVDRTVQSEQPTVSVRSINTQLLLKEDMTAILGGFTVDSDERNISKTPGLGDIPIIGELFKRRTKTSNINRLYFALTVAVLPYGEPIQPVSVPGATTDPPSITPQMKERSDKAEPKQVTAPQKTGP